MVIHAEKKPAGAHKGRFNAPQPSARPAVNEDKPAEREFRRRSQDIATQTTPPKKVPADASSNSSQSSSDLRSAPRQGSQTNPKAAGGFSAPPTKGATRKQHVNEPRKQRPRADVIIIQPEHGKSYSDILRLVTRRDDNKLQSVGEHVRKVRKTATNGLVLEMDGDCKATMEKMRADIGDALGQQARVRTISQETSLEIRDIDCLATREDILAALAPHVDALLAARYQAEHPEVHQASAARYQAEHPEVHQASAARYQAEHPEVHQASAARYQAEHPEVHQASAARYQAEHPDVNQAAVARYQAEHPEVHQASAARYQAEHPEVHQASAARYQAKNPSARNERRLRPWNIKANSAFNYNFGTAYSTDKMITLELVKALQSMLHQCNPYIKDFKTALQKVPKDCKDYKMVIHAEKKPAGAHKGRFNAPQPSARPAVNEDKPAEREFRRRSQDIATQTTPPKKVPADASSNSSQSSSDLRSAPRQGSQTNPKAAGGFSAPPTKGATRKQHVNEPRKQRPRADVIIIQPEHGKSYSDILRLVTRRDDNKLQSVGEHVRKVRKTATNGLVLEMDGDCKATMEKMRADIGDALGQQARVRTISQETSLEIRDIDCLATREDILAALAPHVDALLDEKVIKILRPGYDGSQLNLNHCAAAQDLLKQTVRELSVDVALLSEPYKSIQGQIYAADSDGKAAIWTCGSRQHQLESQRSSRGFLLSGHGCFRSYLHRFGHESDPYCLWCYPEEEETAEHILLTCRRFSSERDELEATIGAQLTADTMISCMLEKEECWSAVCTFAARALTKLRQLERERRRNADDAYLHRFKHERNPYCDSCGPDVIEDAEHVAFHCPSFGREREQALAPNTRLTPDNFVTILTASKEGWAAISRMAANIMKELRRREKLRREQEA
ncbi:hypothetical protein ACLKA6_005697 [Drosophila palustris]